MDIEELKENFKKHVEKYSINDSAISGKYYHSIRVMDLCKEIAKHNNLSEEDIKIAMIIGLLHDYSRFEQWEKYKTFSDTNSIDHGDLAVERLFDDKEIVCYCSNKKYYDEIYDAIKYHNKYDYLETLDERNKLFCKIIRDADKIDIIYQLSMKLDLCKESNKSISEKIKNDFFKNKLLNKKDVKNGKDRTLLHLAMIFDLNFEYSFKYIKENKFIDKMFQNIENKNEFKPYFEYINKYIEERSRLYVRKKI